LKKIALLFFIFLLALSLPAQISWPSITQTMKPWTRWWWMGSAVNKKDLTWNLEQYAKAGLGGVEITPIYGVHGQENQFIEFLSPKWMELLEYTLAEAKRLGIGVDLANATGWPFGGPWVTDADASKTIYYKTYIVTGGEHLAELIEYKRDAMVRTANNKPASIDSILNPVARNKNLQALALDQIQFPGKIPLKCLMGYDGSKAIDLTSKVNSNGSLDWTALPGQWTLYALFEGLHGKMVERAAPGGEGYAIDHFSATAAKNYFKRFDEGFKGHNISYLRAFFNDSYEVDDAREQANWTSDFFLEFKKRKGYDLKEELPALFGKDSMDKSSRVIYDYRSVIDELILDNFTKEWKKWGNSKGKLLRNQSHGSPANTLDLYSVVDIPETEGEDILRFKFATSAANVTGKKLVSSESATWLNEHFLSSWGDVKKAIDLYFLGGVNHIFFHGSEYSPKDAAWPGWLFYAAVHFQSTDPQWKHFHSLNEYIARVQSFLQGSKPDNDVLLYYPIVDRYAEPGTVLLQHFDGMERNFENTEFDHTAKWMLEHGYSFDFFSDRQLQNFNVSGNKIVTGGNSYQVILLPANKLIPEQSLQKLFDLARAGAVILVYEKLPNDVPGFGQLEKRRASFKQLISQLNFVEKGTIKKASLGKGQFLMGDNLNNLLETVGVRNEVLAGNELLFVRRRSNNGRVYFINNRSNETIGKWVTLQTGANAIAVFDPMFSKKGLARWKRIDKEHVEVLLQLQPFESVVVQTYLSNKTGDSYPYVQTQAQPQNLEGNWTIDFLDGGPILPPKVATPKLGSWTELPGDDVKNFSGSAKYSITFQRPFGNSPAWLLNLGEVHETAEVILNGKRIGTVIGPVFHVVFPSSLLRQTNSLEIVVSNLMANRIAYMDRNNLPWKIFYNTNMPARKRENIKNGLFDASSWNPLPSGLIGPVTLTPVHYE